MSNQNITFVLSANDTASPQLKKVNTELTNMQKTSKDMQSNQGQDGGLAGLGKGIMALGVAAAGNEIVGLISDLNTLGIEAQATQSIFAQLASEVGGADTLLASLQKTTGNVVTDMDLMAGASSLLRMGLADSAEGVNDLIGMAVKLKKPTESATEAIDNFSLMLANQSVARLDSFGIASGTVRTRIDELLASGKALNREEAFTMAVMEEGEAAIARLGDAALVSETSLNKLGTRLTNIKTKIAGVVAEGLEAGASLIEIPFMLVAAEDKDGFGILVSAIQHEMMDSFGKNDVDIQNPIVSAGFGRNSFDPISTDSTGTFSVDMAATQANLQAQEDQARRSAVAASMFTTPQMSGNLGLMSESGMKTAHQDLERIQAVMQSLEDDPGLKGLFSESDLTAFDTVVERAEKFADEAERAQTAFDNMSLSGMFGQTDGGRLGELGDLVADNIEDPEQKEAFQSAFNLETGRETAISQAFEDEFAPLLADVFDQYGDILGAEATRAALAALEEGQQSGLGTDTILSNVESAIGFERTGEDGEGPLHKVHKPEGLDFDAVNVSATELQTTVTDISATSEQMTIAAFENSILSAWDTSMLLTKQLEVAAQPATKKMLVKVDFQYSDPQGQKLLQDDMTKIVDDNGGSIPED